VRTLNSTQHTGGVHGLDFGFFGSIFLTDASNRIGQGLDWSQFCRIRTGSNCSGFWNWRIRTGSDCENFCCFNVIIPTISKILVAIGFYRFVKW